MLIKLIIKFYKILSLNIIIFIFFQSHSLSNEGLEIEINNPKFSEKGLDNRLYEIKADRGIQKEKSLELFNIEGKLRTDSGIWIYLNAERGDYNQQMSFIELNGNINFYTDENDKFKSDYALFSINNDLVELNKNVEHIKGSTVIKAERSKMKDNFNYIIYEGNVNTLYVIE
tara:strand:- start:2012 stop:2527 length:516 start_codon:yes stop_codon:yes gene_type:complete